MQLKEKNLEKTQITKIKEEIEHLDRPITLNILNYYFKNVPKKRPGPLASLVNSTKHLKKNYYQSFSNFQKPEEKGTFPNSLCEGSINLIPKTTKTLQENYVQYP